MRNQTDMWYTLFRFASIVVGAPSISSLLFIRAGFHCPYQARTWADLICPCSIAFRWNTTTNYLRMSVVHSYTSLLFIITWLASKDLSFILQRYSVVLSKWWKCEFSGPSRQSQINFLCTCLQHIHKTQCNILYILEVKRLVEKIQQALLDNTIICLVNNFSPAKSLHIIK